MARPLLRAENKEEIVASFKDLEAAMHNLSKENLAKDAVVTDRIKDAQVTVAKLADETILWIAFNGD